MKVDLQPTTQPTAYGRTSKGLECGRRFKDAKRRTRPRSSALRLILRLSHDVHDCLPSGSSAGGALAWRRPQTKLDFHPMFVFRRLATHGAQIVSQNAAIRNCDSRSQDDRLRKVERFATRQRLRTQTRSISARSRTRTGCTNAITV